MRYRLAAWVMSICFCLALMLVGCQRHPERVSQAESGRAPESVEKDKEVAPQLSSDASGAAPVVEYTEETATESESPVADASVESPAHISSPVAPTSAAPLPGRVAEYQRANLSLQATGKAGGYAAPGPASLPPPAEGDIAIDERDFDDVDAKPDEGRGPGEGGDKFNRIYENDFKAVKTDPLSTFSIDVDTASLLASAFVSAGIGQLPPPDAVRIEELVNYFPYDYARPDGPRASVRRSHGSRPVPVEAGASAGPHRPQGSRDRAGQSGRRATWSS